jgi:DNA-binding Lrp family transcriptional regulator
MPTLYEKIRTDNDTPIGRAEDRGIIAGTKQNGRPLRQPRSYPANHTEFAEFSDCDDTPLVHSRYGYAPAFDLYPEDVMVQAYILIQTEVGKAANVAREIAAIDGVTQAEDVTGPYDVIVRAEARNVDELGKLVVAQIQAVEGITRTLTCPIVHI